MGTRIVTFLGLGSPEPPHYQPCVYEWDGVRSIATPIHDAVAVQASEGPVSMLVLGTDAVKERWFGDDQLFVSLLREALPSSVEAQVAFRRLPDGQTEEERWEIFEIFVESLSPHALDWDGEAEGESALKEEAAPDQILVDITHGWRSQSFFAASAVAFVLSERQRQGTRESSPDLRILYAAFQRGQEVTPVWELTQLMTVMEWNAAIDGLMRYGRSDDLSELLTDLHRVTVQRRRAEGLPMKENPKFKKLGAQIRTWADELVTARIPRILKKEKSGLAETLEEVAPALQRWVPPLRAQIEALKSWSTQMVAADVVSFEGLHASLHLADIYLKTQRYSELTSLLRETIVSAWTLVSVESKELLQPEDIGFKEQRQEMERQLGTKSQEPNPKGFPRFYKELADFRNDVQHCGFRSNARHSRTIVEKLPGYVEQIRAELAPLL